MSLEISYFLWIDIFSYFPLVRVLAAAGCYWKKAHLLICSFTCVKM